ncbi:M1 family metallopeptidase [Cesiribacter andamanensis]|uniref:Aminopeptidase N n=1 Tax=Cesiribacter andamanensis AMV16 TaxID=1279009 RepID=M7N5P8_9BACT|nr:M1 family metallopeptidase [Cesiribacter andamanensis]EMR02612.1 aminopeptidase N [Cesiribacter andamanensis AMV16]
MIKKCGFLALALAVSMSSLAQQREENVNQRKFEQLDQELRSPNVYRTASGAPGHQYWQQQADYDIDVRIDDETQRLYGKETITYHNNSPDNLYYLWVQLDQNMRAADSDTYSSETSSIEDRMTIGSLRKIIGYDFDGGFKIEHVVDMQGAKLAYTINKTMMRIDLPQPLKAGEKMSFKIDWWYNINDRGILSDRGGYEFFPEDGNYLYTIAQWFPRMAVYSDFQGWQHKQFLGSGEFALPFGNYKVRITVPSDHIVASTGVLQNPQEVLTKEQQQRFEQAKTAKKPVIIVTQKEAEKKEKTKAKDTKTWVYHADSVRDFAFGSSRKYIWDAMGVDIAGKTVMAMSYYPKEANPLYEQYSTEAVAHTLRVYSRFTIDYPYPVAISVEASNGMEYPMICFNYGRPEKDGTYSDRIKYGMISVIIHEVGHNFFPMIINSDERQWTWMDEGLNTFTQFLAEQEWQRDYPSSRGPAHKIVPYMKSAKDTQRPIMTNSEQVLQFGNNAYGKPATALNILRETVMGRELFDFAFKTYAQRWAFKHPTPEDFFRTMEDASGVDLDWFWKGWFYTNDHVDIALAGVRYLQLNTKDPQVEAALRQELAQRNANHIARTRNQQAVPKTAVESNPSLKDFYNNYNEFAVSKQDKDAYDAYRKSLSAEERATLDASWHFYELQLENRGGLVMPVIVQWQFEDGSSEVQYLPAEIWRYNENKVTKAFAKKKKVKTIVLDPFRETADTDEANNYWPEYNQPSRFELYKQQQGARGASSGGNPMQRSRSNRGN